MNNKEIGAFGEDAACEYLEDNDYEILERNFRLKFAEVDIIAKKDDCTVFIEVKTRKNNLYGEPSEYVNYRKQQRIRDAASCYVDIENTDMRFDVIEVFYTERNGEMLLSKLNHTRAL